MGAAAAGLWQRVLGPTLGVFCLFALLICGGRAPRCCLGPSGPALAVLSHSKMCSEVKSHLAAMAILRGREACVCLDRRVIGYPLALRELKVLGTHQPWSRQCLKSVLDPFYFFLKNRKWSPEGFLTRERE